ncbi:MAG: collagen binding domain-containing protein, partial [Anaerolineae bacterium]
MSQIAKRRELFPGGLAPVLAVLLILLPLVAPPALAVYGAGVGGVVAGPEGGLPPEGTVVRLLKLDGEPGLPGSVFGQVDVDPATGAFGFGAVPNGNYLLRAVPPEASDLTPSLPLPVSVLGAPVDVGTVFLTEPAVVGTVYDPTGTTPTSAWIRIHSGGAWIDTKPATDGVIQIGGLPAGGYQLQAWPMEDDPFWASPPLAVSVTPGVSQTVSLNLMRADVIGYARDAVGNPVHQALARVIDAAGQVVHADLTSPSGFFAIGDLPAGSYRLALEPPWWLGGLIPPLPVAFSVPPLQDLGDVFFQTSHKVVHGRVETNTLQPVAGALIEAHRLDKQGRVRTVSGADGAFTAHLSEGLWLLDVRPISGTVPADWLYADGPQLVHFQHDTTDEVKTVNFEVLTADSHVVGSVTLPDGTAPPFTVTVGIQNDAGIGRRQVLPPGENGIHLALPHGSYKMAILPEDGGYYGPDLPVLNLRPNSTLNLGPLALVERDATISGAVSGGGAALEQIPVVASRSGGQGLWAQGRTGPDGGYVLAVIGGTWLVEPAPEPDQPWVYAGRPVEVEVPAQGAVSGVEFELLA